MTLTLRSLVLAVSITALGATAAAAATNQCVNLMEINDSNVVNDKTILLSLKPRGNYMRVDLKNACPGLRFTGYLHETSINQLCPSDVLKVLDSSGEVCIIDRIATISAADAKVLQTKK